jgi:hypothetical protein
MDCILYAGGESLNADKFHMNFTLCRLKNVPVIMHLTDTNLLVLNTPKYEYGTAENFIECFG